MDIKFLSQHLLDIAKEKYHLVQEIHELTSKQAEMISDKQLTDFFSVAAEKQGIIDKINALDEKFEMQYDLLKKSTDGHIFVEVFSKEKSLRELQSVVIQVTKEMETIKGLELRNKDVYKKVLLDMMVSINHSMANRSEQVLRYKRMNDYKKGKKGASHLTY